MLRMVHFGVLAYLLTRTAFGGQITAYCGESLANDAVNMIRPKMSTNVLLSIRLTSKTC